MISSVYLILASLLLRNATGFVVDRAAQPFTSGAPKQTTTCRSMSSEDDPRAKSSVIYADDSDFDFDPGQGGVRLATESALRLTGTVADAKGTKPQEFLRYTQLTEITDTAAMESILKEQSAQIIATGIGQELYKDPGSSTQQVIELGPVEAVKDLLNTLQSSGFQAKEDMDYIANLAGGDDLQVLEVMDAMGQLRNGLAGFTKKTSLTFSSLSHPSFPLEKVSLTLVALPTEASTNSFRDKGMEKAVAGGLIFFHEGKYLTLAEENINPNHN